MKILRHLMLLAGIMATTWGTMATVFAYRNVQFELKLTEEVLDSYRSEATPSSIVDAEQRLADALYHPFTFGSIYPGLVGVIVGWVLLGFGTPRARPTSNQNASTNEINGRVHR